MKKILPALVFLLASNAFALEIDCKATIRTQWDTKVTTLDLKDRGEYSNEVYAEQKVEGYDIYVSLSNYKINRVDGVSIFIKKDGNTTSVYGSLSKSNNKMSLERYDQALNTYVNIECKEVK